MSISGDEMKALFTGIFLVFTQLNVAAFAAPTAEEKITRLESLVALMVADLENVKEQVTPIGSVMAYGSGQLPEGYLWCDGGTYAAEEYPLLYKRIGRNFGGSDQEFRVPDLRGVFIRGQDQGAGEDPNALVRLSRNGGNFGDRIGSFQIDEVREHNHRQRGGITEGGGDTSANSFGSIARPGAQLHLTDSNHGTQHSTNKYGGEETRPKNVALRYIIKAKK